MDKSKLLLIAGIVALLIGGFLFFSNDDDAINKKNMEIATNATNAQDAGAQIAANNQAETTQHMVAMGLFGMGAMLVLGSFALKKKLSEENL